MRSLLEAAMGREPEKRGAFWKKACGEDLSLLKEVESLLLAVERGEGVEQAAPSTALGSMGMGGTGETATVGSPRRELNKDGSTPVSNQERSIGPYRLV